jgi:hypothetical protein
MGPKTPLEAAFRLVLERQRQSLTSVLSVIAGAWVNIEEEENNFLLARDPETRARTDTDKTDGTPSRRGQEPHQRPLGGSVDAREAGTDETDVQKVTHANTHTSRSGSM